MFQFCLALRYFATGGLYSIIGDTQHVSKSLVGRAVKDVSDFFYAHQADYIRWPESLPEKIDNAAKFLKHKNTGTPHIIGIVDGTHIAIKTPDTNESCYVNRKGYHSINTTVSNLSTIVYYPHIKVYFKHTMYQNKKNTLTHWYHTYIQLQISHSCYYPTAPNAQLY